ncbi:Histone-lysine N-methyltransferase SETMAR [Melipona quadrifasciata]|uniref:Histone-lysine N-methyltransferase SETMAR n=1 Tax=Melipona quadrifasciata TaxID=166423 RepID=A0A0M9A3P9_9HYME|nr:Histone-lysine N-methyltransferase SETMAR [Melipona quadrifasciata]
MLHCFKKGNSAKDTAEEIFTVYGSGTTTIRTVGNFDMKDEDRSGRPATTDTDIIKTVLTENSRYSVREIVDATNIPKTTVHKHRYEVWVPHLFIRTETGLTNRVSTCDLLLQRHERDPFLKRLVTGDETWILYQNVHRKRTWSKENRPSTIWWDWKGVKSKLKQFWKEGIMRLPERWKKVIEQNGSYIT